MTDSTTSGAAEEPRSENAVYRIATSTMTTAVVVSMISAYELIVRLAWVPGVLDRDRSPAPVRRARRDTATPPRSVQLAAVNNCRATAGWPTRRTTDSTSKTAA